MLYKVAVSRFTVRIQKQQEHTTRFSLYMMYNSELHIWMMIQKDTQDTHTQRRENPFYQRYQIWFATKKVNISLDMGCVTRRISR